MKLRLDDKGFKSGCVAVLLGFILFVGSFFVLWINEINYVNAQRMAKFMSKNVVSIKNYSPDNNRKLVHYTELINTEEYISDDFIRVKTPALDRTVQMYQWEEESYTNNNVTEYRYKKNWNERQIDSSLFHNSGYNNPPMNYHSRKYRPHTATLGEFELNKAVIDSLQPKISLDIRPVFRGNNKIKTTIYGTNTLYLPTTAGYSEKIGDYKITYKYIPPKTSVSVIAAQSDKTLTSFVNSKFNIALSYVGSYTDKEMIKMFEDEKSTEAMKWRIIGAVMMLIGLLALISPLTTVLSFVPILGNIGNKTLFGLAITLSLSLTGITIALAWLAVRPEISIPILIIAGIVLWLALFYKGKLK